MVRTAVPIDLSRHHHGEQRECHQRGEFAPCNEIVGGRGHTGPAHQQGDHGERRHRPAQPAALGQAQCAGHQQRRERDVAGERAKRPEPTEHRQHEHNGDQQRQEQGEAAVRGPESQQSISDAVFHCAITMLF
jgi:hypothetical protein